VLWIDEVEKGLSGTGSSNFSDGGTMARVFGTLLTSMEEGMKGVTIIATANDISALPPEFIRRFDEVLFVDLPGPDEREEIFKIHLRIKGQDFSGLDLKHLVAISENFTGHEIEKAVKRSITFAYNSKEKKVITEQLVQALTEKQPLFNTMREKLSKLREKAADRFRFASSWARDQAKGIIIKQKSMSVDDIDLPSMETKKSSNEPVISLD
jgi:SpoVK/Ycf46/Vps4 family AAA+-type ATPase